MSEPNATMSRLEQRYRRLLRLLPVAYRAMWQEEMVTTFLASMHTDDAEQAEYLADYGRPSWSEMASVVALAVRLRIPGWRLRLGGKGAPPRNVVWGDAVRLVALIGLLSHTTSFAGTLNRYLGLIGLSVWPPPTPESDYVAHTASFRLGAITGFVWLAAYLVLLFGQRRLGQLLAVLAIVITDTAMVLSGILLNTISGAANVVLNLALAMALLAFHRDAPPVRWRPWLLALPVGIIVQTGLLLLTLPADWHTFPLLDGPAVCCLALAIAAMVHLVGPGRGTPSWSLALALLAAAVFALRALTLLDLVQFAPVTQRSTLLALGIVEAGVVLAVAIPLVTRANRALRRLPTGA